MTGSTLLSRLLYRWNLKAARVLLDGRFSMIEVDAMIRSVENRYRDLAPGLPEEKTLGAELHLMSAQFCAALYRTLEERKVEEVTALAIISDLNWGIYSGLMAPVLKLAPILFRNPGRLGDIFLQAGLNGVCRSVFRAPGWTIEEVPVDGGVGIDILRCPLADYLLPLGLDKVCDAGFCEMDRRMAEAAGLRLEVAGTIAGGADRCGYRVLPGV